jgi:glucose-6-phosphate isomerase
MSSELCTKLQQHYATLANQQLTDLFSENSERAKQFSLDFAGLYFDFSKHKINHTTLDLLIELANARGLDAAITAQFSGQKINTTEQRAVLHTALRSPHATLWLNGHNVMDEIAAVRKQMEQFCAAVHSGAHRGYTGKKIDTIVNIGIGGSDLGPVLVTQALKPYKIAGMHIEFISSVDGYMVTDILAKINPETTLFVVASKTFTTQETMTNAHTVRQWLLNHANADETVIAKHFVALSTNIAAIEQFGIRRENIFPFWDFVGGRYSLWSAIGLSIALYIGYANFSELLAGAHAMDQHFQATTDYRQNLPVIMALIGYWYANYFKYPSLIISPYNTRLTRFPAYVQQLEMESNGKSVNLAGEKVTYPTCPIIWGDSGINGQHAYYQLLHQGTQIVPMDIIIAVSAQESNRTHNDILWANAIAQAEALMRGKTYAEALQELIAGGMDRLSAAEIAKHKVFSGNRPTSMLVLPEISPYYLGMLIALYEHKTFVQGVLWNINSFDQMGVELGKQLAKVVLADIEVNAPGNHDQSTVALIQHYLANREKFTKISL